MRIARITASLIVLTTALPRGRIDVDKIQVNSREIITKDYWTEYLTDETKEKLLEAINLLKSYGVSISGEKLGPELKITLEIVKES